MTTYYVYTDQTNDGVVFYVGKGQLYRVKAVKRNRKHTHVRESLGFNRTVVFETDDEAIAFTREQTLITEYHTFVGDALAGPYACNFTLGGDGTSGHGPLRAGNPNYRKPKSQTMRDRLSQAKMGKGNAMFGTKQTPEFIEKRTRSLRGRKHNHGDKISAALTGKKLSEEHRQALSESHKGLKPSEETQRKMSESQKRRFAMKRPNDETV